VAAGCAGPNEVVGLGCNNFGIGLDVEGTRNVVHQALDAGITLFDTADHYGNMGRSEDCLGQVFGDRRKDTVLATKFGVPMDQPGRRKGYRGAAGSLEQTAGVLCVEIEVDKHMDDQSVAQGQSSSLGKSSFAAVTVLAVCFVLSGLGRGSWRVLPCLCCRFPKPSAGTRGQITSIYSRASLAGALTSPLVGRMFERCGPRVAAARGGTRSSPKGRKLTGSNATNAGDSVPIT
jgi:hypothetical protein